MFFSVPFCWDLGKQNSLKPYHSLPFLKKTKTNPESTNIYLRHWFGTHGNDWNALSPWLIVLPPAHGAPKELIWEKKKKERLLTLNRLFTFISHLCCDFNQQSPDVATAALLAQEASMCCPESRLSPSLADFSERGIVMSLCCPSAQPDVNISQAPTSIPRVLWSP